MAERDPLLQQPTSSRDLASRIHALSAPGLSTRLLPYEYQLITELGCTENEYRRFKEHVQWLSRERPAAYDRIPDIENGDFGISLLISVIVGAVFQGAAYLLAPKPDIPQQQRQITNRTLDSISGRDRFAPTYGFQASQELTRYGETIPLVFTQQKRVRLNINGTTSDYTVGGVMISPKLVWSRMNSWGGYQTLQLVFLVGQSPMDRGPYNTPALLAADRSGIYIGQLPLDSFSPGDYRWYYYKGGTPVGTGLAYKGNGRSSTDSRLLGQNYVHGGLGTAFPPADNVFNAQTFAGLTEKAFCHVWTPSTQTRFGVYSGLPNGTPYRVNFEIVSRPVGSNNPTGNAQIIARRIQITGNHLMNGTGRNYGRQFGIIAFNGDDKSVPANKSNGNRVKVNLGDKITVIYNAAAVVEDLVYDKAIPWHTQRNNQSGDRYEVPIGALAGEEPLKNTEIRTAIKAEHEQQDDLLKTGTKWLVGNCLFEVEKRTPEKEIYDKSSKQTFSVVLKCIAIYADGDAGYVGVCNRSFVTTDSNLPERVTGPLYDIEETWFPLCRADFATFQNSRRCEATEIGIKSNVWTRFNGLCNFNSVISANALDTSDKNKINITSGTMQTYARRASFFNLYVRAANNDEGPDEGWVKLNKYPFCVVGSTPQDQFNSIRIGHPFQQFEYRIRPLTSGEVVHIIGLNKVIDGIEGPCIRLNADGLGSATAREFWNDSSISTKYGTFTLQVLGKVSQMKALARHSELVSELKATAPFKPAVMPVSTVRFVKAIFNKTGAEATARQISNGISKSLGKDPDPAGEEGFPDVPRINIPVNGEYIFNASDKDKFKFSSGGREVELDMRLRVIDLGPINAKATRSLYWSMVNGNKIEATFAGTWKEDDEFRITTQLLGGSQGLAGPLDTITYIFRVNAPEPVEIPTFATGDRVFENNSAIAEVSHYGALITRSCDNGPEHEITYVNENLANDPVRNGVANYEGCAMAGLFLRSNPGLTTFEQLHLYQRNGLEVTNIRRKPNGDVDTSEFGPSSIFTDLAYYLLTNKQTGAGELISSQLIDLEQFARTGSFLEANHLYYDDVIVEPQNLRDFMSRIAATLLCNLVMRNGRFSIEPALPISPSRNYTFLNVKVPIKGIFTEGNIIEDSFQLEYVPTSERLPIRALLRYRTEAANRFPQEQTVVVYYTDQPNGPIEEFNFTHITSRYHAELFAKYALSSRRHRTHIVSFKTTPYGLGLAPGDFIRVVTQSGYTSLIDELKAGKTNVDVGFDLPPFMTGIIKDDGTVVTPYIPPASEQDPQAIYSFNVYYWDNSTSSIKETFGNFTVSGTAIKCQNLKSCIFARNAPFVQAQTYMIDSLQLNEDGLVEITASYFPVDSATGFSNIAMELDPGYSGFTVVADLSPD